jgi:hypothetical protein
LIGRKKIFLMRGVLKQIKSLPQIPLSGCLKGLSYEVDFENVDKGRGWFLNFSEAPLIFG